MARRRANPLAALDGAKPHQRVCETPGCRLQGEYRAPRARDKLDEYRWFCLEHVRDYNKKWDYFAGLDSVVEFIGTASFTQPGTSLLCAQIRHAIETGATSGQACSGSLSPQTN